MTVHKIERPLVGGVDLFPIAASQPVFPTLDRDQLVFHVVFLELFGQSIAIDNGVVAVGAPDNGFGSGSAYVFDVREEQGVPIPTVSEWGLIVMTLLLLTTGTLLHARARAQ